MRLVQCLLRRIIPLNTTESSSVCQVPVQLELTQVLPPFVTLPKKFWPALHLCQLLRVEHIRS